MINISNLSFLSIAELENLNRRVVAALKSARREESIEIGSSLCIGDNVTFVGRRGQPMTGTVTKINRVKAKVKVGMTTWTCPMNLLTRV
jgi:hypothetical protein